MSFSPDRAHMPTEPEIFTWVTEVEGQTHDIEIPYYAHPDAASRDIHTEYYGGLGEGPKALPWAVHELHKSGVDAVAVDMNVAFRQLPPDAKNLEMIATEAPTAITQYLNEKAERAADARAHRLGSSQGSGAAVISAGAAPELVDAVGVMGALGYNMDAFQGGRLGPKATFLVRFGVMNALMRREQNPLLDPRGNMQALGEVGGFAIGNAVRGELNPKLDFALGTTLLPQADRLIREGRPFRVFIGERDPIFRKDEVRAGLAKVDAADHLEVIPGSHGTTLNWGGRRQLGRVGEWVQEVEVAREAPQDPDESGDESKAA